MMIAEHLEFFDDSIRCVRCLWAENTSQFNSYIILVETEIDHWINAQCSPFSEFDSAQTSPIRSEFAVSSVIFRFILVTFLLIRCKIYHFIQRAVHIKTDEDIIAVTLHDTPSSTNAPILFLCSPFLPPSPALPFVGLSGDIVQCDNVKLPTQQYCATKYAEAFLTSIAALY